MSEAEELKEFKQKLELKYGRLAKKRLAKISKVANTEKQLIDMTDEEFEQQLNKWFSNNQASNDQNTNQLDQSKEPSI
ncbi:hypothetical protein H5W18_10875 [Lactobacillus sp. Marseille-P7033]|nr:hypothetical protein [Lactobacillus sp. Marseille-P7033]NGC78952.1 hypothetical protein [Limosilactobacillus reuteri]